MGEVAQGRGHERGGTVEVVEVGMTEAVALCLIGLSADRKPNTSQWLENR